MDDIIINKLGGINNVMDDCVNRAKEVDLITLPKDIKGANCSNCAFFNDISERIGYCLHKRVKQNVNNRMCCVLWTHPAESRMYVDRLKDYD